MEGARRGRGAGPASGAAVGGGTRVPAQSWCLEAGLGGRRPALYGPGRGRSEAGAGPLAGILLCRKEWGRPERGAWKEEREACVGMKEEKGRKEKGSDTDR